MQQSNRCLTAFESSAERPKWVEQNDSDPHDEMNTARDFDEQRETKKLVHTSPYFEASCRQRAAHFESSPNSFWNWDNKCNINEWQKRHRVRLKANHVYSDITTKRRRTARSYQATYSFLYKGRVTNEVGGRTCFGISLWCSICDRSTNVEGQIVSSQSKIITLSSLLRLTMVPPGKEDNQSQPYNPHKLILFQLVWLVVPLCCEIYERVAPVYGHQEVMYERFLMAGNDLHLQLCIKYNQKS